MSMEQLRKCGSGLVADPGRDPRNPLVACFEQKRGLRHPARDQITVHGLADELGEASRKRRAAEPHALPEVAQGSRADPAVRGSTEAPVRYAGPPSPQATRLRPGPRDLIQLRNTSTKSTSVSRESATPWPGRSSADSLTMRRRIASSQSPSAVGFRRSTGGSNSSTLPREGRDTVKLPQIIVESGCALPP